MTLHITRSNLLCHSACAPGLERFDEVYLGIDEQQQIELLEIAENPKFETIDVIFALRATIEDSKGVSAEFVKVCAARAAAAYDAAYDAARATYAADAATATADDVARNAATYAAAYDAERKLQREHLIQLLGE